MVASLFALLPRVVAAQCSGATSNSDAVGKGAMMGGSGGVRVKLTPFNLRKCHFTDVTLSG